jgi:hypothetical protein
MQGVLRYADPEAPFAWPLHAATPSGARGMAMWNAKLARAALRAYWGGLGYRRAWVIAAGTRYRLAATLQHAAFLKLDFEEATERMWRGRWGVPVSQARARYSWTLDRDMACLFALRSTKLTRRLPVMAAQGGHEGIVPDTNERKKRMLC